MTSTCVVFRPDHLHHDAVNGLQKPIDGQSIWSISGIHEPGLSHPVYEKRESVTKANRYRELHDISHYHHHEELLRQQKQHLQQEENYKKGQHALEYGETELNCHIRDGNWNMPPNCDNALLQHNQQVILHQKEQPYNDQIKGVVENQHALAYDETGSSHHIGDGNWEKPNILDIILPQKHKQLVLEQKEQRRNDLKNGLVEHQHSLECGETGSSHPSIDDNRKVPVTFDMKLPEQHQQVVLEQIEQPPGDLKNGMTTSQTGHAEYETIYTSDQNSVVDILKQTSEDDLEKKQPGDLENGSTTLHNGLEKNETATDLNSALDSLKKNSGYDLEANVAKFLTQQKSKNYKRPLEVCSMYTLNMLTNYVIIGPLTVAFWCATWALLAEYIPGCYVICVVCLAISFPGILLSIVFQDILYRLSLNSRGIKRLLITRLYSYLVGLFYTMYWRGLWGIQECALGTGDWRVEAVTLAASACLLAVLRCLSINVGAPISPQMDTQLEIHFTSTTFFTKKPGSCSSIPDSLFTTGVVCSLGICFWKGTWNLINIYLYPDDVTRSACFSLVISYSLVVLLYTSQSICVQISISLERHHWLAKLAFEDVITILYSLIGITHWRGVWMLLDEYLPFQPYSMFVMHVTSFAVLAAGLTANTILTRGCPRDGVLTNGQGVLYDTFYLNHMITELRKRRRRDRSDSVFNLTPMNRRVSIADNHIDTDTEITSTSDMEISITPPTKVIDKEPDTEVRDKANKVIEEDPDAKVRDKEIESDSSQVQVQMSI